MKTKNSILRRGIIAMAFATICSVFLVYCKKEAPKNRNGGTESKILNHFKESGVTIAGEGFTYSSVEEMLSCISLEQFNQIQAIILEQSSGICSALDNGHTFELLSAIGNVAESSVLADSLINNSPLSDTVLVKLMSTNFPEAQVVRVLKANLDFSVKSIDYFLAKGYTTGTVNEVINAAKIRTPYCPGSTEFESLFPGFESYRHKITAEEVAFLANGGDPESVENPYNSALLTGIEATLYNKYLEIKIAGEIMKLLPHRTVLIKNASMTTVNYIRTNGTVPMVTPPSTEPSNGLEKADAPPVVDDNIVVDPSDYHPFNGKQVKIICEKATAEHTYQFSSNITEAGTKYYWDFGDGLVSYKANPTHTFSGEENIYVTLRVFDSFGAVKEAVYGSNIPQARTQDCVINVSWAGGQTAGLMASASIYVSDEPNPINPFNYSVSWGDNTALEVGSWTSPGWKTLYHTYASYGNFFTSIKVTRTQDNGLPPRTCEANRNTTINMADPAVPNPEPEPCCDKLEREVEEWKSASNNLKFKHMFKLRNNFITKGKLDAEVRTFHRISVFGIGHVWFAINANACLGMIGEFHQPCNNSSRKHACDSTAKTIPGFTECGCWYHHNVERNGGANCYIYLEKNKISSNASCWGYNSYIDLADCD